MPTTIKLKNSVTTTNAPTSLVQGEVAINITDKKVWVGDAATTPIQLLGAGASASFSALSCTTLSASGVATFSAGTVSAPAITTTGDTNTGIFFPAADTIAFTEGGVESMRIDSSGNVGIGTSSQNERLRLNSSTTAQARMTISYANSPISYFGSYEGIIGSGNATDVVLSSANVLAFASGGTTERMRIDSSGNLLVGATSGYRSGKLVVKDVNRTQTSTTANLHISTTDTQGADIGGSIGLGGQVGGDETPFGYISGRKENSTSANYAGYLAFATQNSSGGVAERMRINSGGNVGIGTSSPTNILQVNASDVSSAIYSTRTTAAAYLTIGNVTDNTLGLLYSTGSVFQIRQRDANSNSAVSFWTQDSERMRITSGGNLLVGKTADDATTAGLRFSGTGTGIFTSSSDLQIICNRLTNDGTLILFRQDNNDEGSISVSGTTVSYNGGHLSRWSQLPNNQKDDTLLKGTVMSNLDDMCVWVKDGEELPNEQLNKMKVSDVEGDTNIAGVFVSWQFDEQCQSDDMNVAMTGDMIIRIAQGVVVQKGDLLMSAGDGTAKPQGDDICRSKTIAKVTSNHVTCTYADGSYCVPCVLMAC